MNINNKRINIVGPVMPPIAFTSMPVNVSP